MAATRLNSRALIWTLSAILASVFLLAGLPKLFGSSAIGFQAAAMTGFPQWIRVLVGTVEVAGAIGLLVPPTASFAALMLGVIMIPAMLTQYASGLGGVYVPAVLLAMLMVLAWQRDPAAVQRFYRTILHRPHALLREGVIAGLIGASVTAVWFLAVDSVAGAPLRTPAAFGMGLLGVLGPGTSTDSMTQYVVVYTAFHFIAFITVGLVAALTVHAATREPSILLGSLVLFAVIEIGFYGATALLDQASSLRSLAWFQVMLGNLIAASCMGVYFWRKHRHLLPRVRDSLEPSLSSPEAMT